MEYPQKQDKNHINFQKANILNISILRSLIKSIKSDAREHITDDSINPTISKPIVRRGTPIILDTNFAIGDDGLTCS